MPHASQVTEVVINAPNPVAKRDELWAKARYLMAQKPVTDDFSGTDDMHYLGRVVIPGPMANPEIAGTTVVQDPDKLSNDYGIAWLDYITTAGADRSVTDALYTLMSSSEADDYERQVFAQRKEAAQKATQAKLDA